MVNTVMRPGMVRHYVTRAEQNSGGGGGGSTVYADNIVSLPQAGENYITNLYWDPVADDVVYVHDSNPPANRLVSNPPSGYQIIENMYWDTATDQVVYVLGSVVP